MTITKHEAAARGITAVLLWDRAIGGRLDDLGVAEFRALAARAAAAAINPPTWLVEVTGDDLDAARTPIPPSRLGDSGVRGFSPEDLGRTDDPLAHIPPLEEEDG